MVALHNTVKLISKLQAVFKLFLPEALSLIFIKINVANKVPVMPLQLYCRVIITALGLGGVKSLQVTPGWSGVESQAGNSILYKLLHCISQMHYYCCPQAMYVW